MTITNADETYLNKEGLAYLIQQIKEQMGDNVTVDLSGYYTAEQIDELLESLETGTGSSGSNGVGIATVELSNYELVITLTDGTVLNLGNIRGATGETGTNGEDGADGTDGVSPTITENTDNDDSTYKLDITDVNGTFTTPNLKGADGQDGTSTGSTGAGSTDLVSSNIYVVEEETAIGTWTDGNTIYRQVFSLTAPTVSSSSSVSANYYYINDYIDVNTFGNLVNMSCLYNITTKNYGYCFSGLGYYPSSLSSSVSTIAAIRDCFINMYLYGNTTMYIYTQCGYKWSNQEIIVTVEYTKTE